MSKWKPIHDATKALAGVCDGAVERDKAGFNGPDSRYGKQLAMLAELSPRQARNAHTMLKKYTKQLAGLGVDYAALIAPTDDELQKAPGPNGQPGGKLIDVDKDGEHFRIIHPFEVAKEMIPHLSIFPGRRFERVPFGHWQIPATAASASRIQEFGVTHDYEITPEATALFDEIMGASGGLTFDELPPEMKHPDRYLEDGKNKSGTKPAICVFFGFSPEFKELYGIVSGMDGAQFKGDRKPVHWAVTETARNAIALLAMAAKYFFSIPGDMRDRLKALADAETKNEREAEQRKKVLMLGAQDVAVASFGGKKARPYQAAGVSFLLENQFALNADDMGLGKTFESMLWARAFQRAFSTPVFVLCPKNLKSGWAKEAEACGVKVEIYSWAKPPKPLSKNFVLIADEAHYAQSMKAARTQAMLDLALSPHCIGALMVSGTPMRGGRPANIFPLLRAIRHPLGNDRKHFEKYYCNAHHNGFAWDTTGAAHLDELMESIRPVMLRRTKDQVLKDLPAKQRVLRDVEIGPALQKQYADEVNKRQAEYVARKLETKNQIDRLIKLGHKKEDIIGAKRKELLGDASVLDGGEELVLLNHIRSAGSIAKVDAAIEIADEVLEQGRSVILFTEFVPSAEALAAHYRKAGLGVELLTGKPSDDRQAMIDRFQAKKSRVWISTIKAGGVGLTLTAASDVVLIDRPYMVDDAQQAEDRAHRIGQQDNVTTYWLRGFEVDEKIDARLLDQEAVLKSVMAGDRKTLRGVQSVNQMAKEIVGELFSKAAKAAA